MRQTIETILPELAVSGGKSYCSPRLLAKFGDLQIGNTYSALQGGQVLPDRTAHLGIVWELLANNAHVGRGVFHKSCYNVASDGRNLFLLDHNFVPSRSGGDQLWFPGYQCSDDHMARISLYHYDSTTDSYRTSARHKALFHPFLFTQDGTPLTHLHIDALREHFGKARTQSEFFAAHSGIVRECIESVIKRCLSVQQNPASLADRIISISGECFRAAIGTKNGYFTCDQLNVRWDPATFSCLLTDVIMIGPGVDIGSYTKRIADLFRMAGSDCAPYPTNSLKQAILHAVRAESADGDNYYCESGGYDMAGVLGFCSGYHSSVKNKIYRFYEIMTPRRTIHLVFPAAIFSIGSHCHEDLETLNSIIEGYLKLRKNFLIGKQVSLEVMALIRKYERQLSEHFWDNFRSLTSGEIRYYRNEFTNPEGLKRLTFKEGSQLAGHFRHYASLYRRA